MAVSQALNGFIRDPRMWADECRTRAGSEPDPEARAVFTQLAEEFDAAASEIEGLIGAFEAVVGRRKVA
jgi:hypothetical protein